jgi:hypothetical protein
MTIVQQQCVKCSRTVWAYATDEHPQCPAEVCGVRYMLPAEVVGEPSNANYSNAHHTFLAEQEVKPDAN